MRRNLSLLQKGLICVGLAVLAELLFLGLIARMVLDAESQLAEDSRVRSVIAHLTQITNALQGTSTGLVGSAMPPGASELGGYEGKVSQILAGVEEVKRLVRGHASEEIEIKTLESTCNWCVPLFDKYINAHIEQTPERNNYKRALVGTSARIIRLSDKLVDDYRTAEEEGLYRQQRMNDHLNFILLCGLAMNVVIALSLLSLFTRGITDRLKLLLDNSQRLSEDSPLAPTMRGKDEIALVDSAFHKMADALKESRLRERAVVEQSADVICALDQSCRFTTVSPAALPMWGYEPKELIGESLETIALSKELTSAMHDGRPPMSMESRIRRKDGGVLQTLWSARWSPERNSLYCVAHDITERKRGEDKLRTNEARIRTLIEHLPACVIVADGKGSIESMNPRARAMFHCAEERVRAIGLAQLLAGTDAVPDSQSNGDEPDDEPEEFAAADQNLEQQHGGPQDREKRGREEKQDRERQDREKPDRERQDQPEEPNESAAMIKFLAGSGSRELDGKRQLQAKRLAGGSFPSEVTMTRLEAPEGERFLVIVQDITQRYEVEQLKQQFVAMISHDVRTPLMSVEASLSLLAAGAMGQLPEQIQEDVINAESDIAEIISLINCLLDIERMKAGYTSRSLTETQIMPVLERSYDAVCALCDRRGIALQVVPTEVSACIDENQISRALIIILTEAIKSAGSGESISIRAEHIGQHIDLKVIHSPNNAVKISNDEAATRLDLVHKEKAHKRLTQAICQTIAEQHAGSFNFMVEARQKIYTIRLRTAETK